MEKKLGFFIETDENYALLRTEGGDILRHANEFEEVLWNKIQELESQLREKEARIKQLEGENYICIEREKLMSLLTDIYIRGQYQGAGIGRGTAEKESKEVLLKFGIDLTAKEK